jgi:hypothetical protein
MSDAKVRINMTVSPEFWEKWQAYAETCGMSASALFELTGTAMIDGAAGLLPVMKFAKDFEAHVSKLRGKKK